MSKERGPWQNGIRWVRYESGDRVWEAKVKVKGSVVYKTFSSRKQARLWVNNSKSKRDKSGVVKQERVTAQKLFDDYLLKHKRENNAESTVITDKLRFENYIKPFYNTLDLSDLEIEHHQLLFDDMESRGKSPQLRDKVRTLLHSMFEYAVRKQHYGGAFPYNPIKAIDKPKFEKPQIEWLNPAQIIQFLEANKSSPYYPMFVVGFYTGLRIGELCGLNWEQIDLAHHVLTVDRQWNEKEKRVTRTKGRTVRHLGLIEEVQEVLYPLKGQGLVFRKLTGRNLVGGKLLPNYFRKEILPEACKMAEVKEIDPHGMRHSFAALWLIQGGRLETLQKLMGHRSYKTTEDSYGHLDFSHIQNQMGIISRVGNVSYVDFGRGGLREGLGK